MNHKKKSPLREWIEAIIVAIVIATIIRWFSFEHYLVPSSSMENTILTGDHLLVSKLHYGARTPITPLQLPLTHKTIGNSTTKSFSTKLQWPSYRLPGLFAIKRGDMVVFNYPMELEFPTDIREFYIKRCIALPGDTIKIENTKLYINEEPSQVYPGIQFRYYIKTNENLTKSFFQRYNITEAIRVDDGYIINANATSIENLQKCTFVKNIIRIISTSSEPDYRIYANETCILNWNADFFGPTKIPKKGMMIPINKETLAHYGSCIVNHDSQENAYIKEDQLFINDQIVTDYTFRQDYYFMMGDNRHNSVDSRYWGFVPEDHIVGKAILVLFSRDQKEENFFQSIRWRRILKVL